jgi:hypothetical protein
MKRNTRLHIEALEDRSVPATFEVLSLADSGAGSLRQAVLDANVLAGADTIHFADGLVGTIGLTTGQLSITDHLTIDGPGAGLLAVSGNHQSRVFNLSGGAVVGIDHLTITGGQVVGDGGGILNTASTLTLDRVVLTDNLAVGTSAGNGRGGAVANVSGAALVVTDCLFIQNQALGGGQGFGGGIVNVASRLMVTRSTFVGNQALGGPGGGAARGGAIDTSNALDVRISDSTFVDNQAIGADGRGGIGFGRGGGLYNTAGIVTVENSTFQGNLARGGSNNARGGALIGPAGGGGIFNADAATLFLTGSTVVGNLAMGGSNNISTGGNGNVGNAYGGGLSNVGTVTISDSVFEDNEARGGSANRGDGASFQFVGTSTGGGIFTSAQNTSGQPASLTLSNVTLRHNRAVGGDDNTAGTFMNAGIGGGLANNGSNPFAATGGSTIILVNSNVANNQAVGGRGADGLGGGVANVLGGVVHVSGSTLTRNAARGGGGADGLGGGIYNGAASTHPSNLNAPTVLTVEGTAIAFNAAFGGPTGDGLGGGLWNGSTATVTGATFSHNRAIGGDGGDGLGGGIFNDASASLRLEGTSVTKNHANGGDGGSDGEGIGGGLYNLGLLDLDALTLIFGNHASTSHDDVFSL